MRGYPKQFANHPMMESDWMDKICPISQSSSNYTMENKKMNVIKNILIVILFAASMIGCVEANVGPPAPHRFTFYEEYADFVEQRINCSTPPAGCNSNSAIDFTAHSIGVCLEQNIENEEVRAYVETLQLIMNNLLPLDADEYSIFEHYSGSAGEGVLVIDNTLPSINSCLHSGDLMGI